jgi:hypothetical protein
MKHSIFETLIAIVEQDGLFKVIELPARAMEADPNYPIFPSQELAQECVSEEYPDAAQVSLEELTAELLRRKQGADRLLKAIGYGEA